MPTIPINDIVNVAISVSSVSAVRAGFNLGLIIGSSAIVSAVDRVKLYSSLEEMIAAGFDAAKPEHKAALLYFSQNPKPTKVAIGRWDKTGIETAVEAVIACRAANTDWYAFTICDAVEADILLVAAYTEAMAPSGAFFYTTKDADVPLGTAGNVMLALKAANYKKTLGQYSETDYAVAAIMGYAMGANTKAAGSAYTLAYKSEIGVVADDLDNTELGAILDANGNAYINQGTYYNLFRQGKMASGVSFDEVLGLDMLSNDIQLSIMDLLAGQSKVPQFEDGVTMLINAINSTCAASLSRGFLAPGVWKGPQILDLAYGDTLSQGFMVQAESLAGQTQADREARKSPNLLVAVKLAGAIEFAVIVVNVNR
jgi:hypothetical protein